MQFVRIPLSTTQISYQYHYIISMVAAVSVFVSSKSILNSKSNTKKLLSKINSDFRINCRMISKHTPFCSDKFKFQEQRIIGQLNQVKITPPPADHDTHFFYFKRTRTMVMYQTKGIKLIL